MGVIFPRPINGASNPETLPWAVDGTTLAPTFGQTQTGHEPYGVGPAPDYRRENYARRVAWEWRKRLMAGALHFESQTKSINIGGAVNIGDIRRVTVDGNSLDLATDAGMPDNAAIAAAYVAAINADPVLSLLVEAIDAGAGNFDLIGLAPGATFVLAVAMVVDVGGASTITVTDAGTTPVVRIAGDLPFDRDFVYGIVDLDGNGTRFQFRRSKAAFRAGSTAGGEWIDANTGLGSFAAGVDPIASGDGSQALGNGAVATGAHAFAQGGSIATGQLSFAAGVGVASADEAVAMGVGAVADKLQAQALGAGAEARGLQSIALGVGASVANGATGGIAIGDSAAVVGVVGNATAIGPAASAAEAAATAIGNGASVAAGATGGTALGNGAIVGADGDNAIAGPASTANGLTASAFGGGAATADHATAAGGGAASGQGSTAIGEGADATAQGAVALGEVARATGRGAVAFGRQYAAVDHASGEGAMASGSSLGGVPVLDANDASASNSRVHGRGNQADATYGDARGYGSRAHVRGMRAYTGAPIGGSFPALGGGVRGSAQGGLIAASVQTLNDVVGILALDGLPGAAETMLIRDLTAVSVRGEVIGYGAGGKVARYSIDALLHRNGGAAVLDFQAVVANFETDAAWGCVFAAAGNGFSITVQAGLFDAVTNWCGSFRLVEVLKGA